MNRESPNRPRHALRAGSLLLAAALSACADNAYYLKSDAAVGMPAELSALDPAFLADHPLEVAVTFKSADVVEGPPTDALYQSIAYDLRSRGIHHLQRYAPLAGDVSVEIAWLKLAASGEAPPAASIAPPGAPRLLVLVENHPDLSGGTRTRYFVSGLSLGTWSPNRPTDRYDVTIAYRDPQGVAHLYRSHQELILSTGTNLFNRDEAGLNGLRRYDDPLAAFGGAVTNSINGPGTITVGRPQSSAAAASSP